MRKIIVAACIVALACGLFACGSGGEPYQPKFNDEKISVDKVDSSGKVKAKLFLEMLDNKRGQEYQPLKNSFVVSRQESYRDHWYRVVYYAYPRFGSEIEGPAARKIKQYYKAQYKACDAREDFPWLTEKSEVADNTQEMLQYRLQVYAVTLLEDYVCVKFHRESYIGGSKIEILATADVFDSKTGEKLALDEAVDLAAYAQAINKAVADHLRFSDIRPHEKYDVLQAENQMFSVTQDSLLLLFAPDELAPVAYGPIEVTVSWKALGK